MIENRADQYILDHLAPESEILSEIYRHTHVNVLYPGMISGHEQGRLLAMISRMVQPDQILEIGTFTGYSAICLSEGLRPEGRLHTIEQNDEIADTAAAFFEKAGLADKITLHVGDALEIIPALDIRFDLVFIDAAKKQYSDYYSAVFDKVKSGGYILADNILWYGKVFNPDFKDETTDKLREFNNFVGQDTRVEKAIVKNRDGLFILRKK